MDVLIRAGVENPDGAANGDAIICGYPASRNDLGGLHDHESVSSSSAPSVDDFFDWEKYEQDQGSDVTTPSSPSSSSDVPARDESAPTTPLGEALDGPAAAQDGEDHPMYDAPSPPSPQLANVWPNFEPSSPPRAAALILDPSPSPPASGGMQLDTPATSPAATTPPGHKRTRVIKNPDETNKVRKEGACLPCSMDKIGRSQGARLHFGIAPNCLPPPDEIYRWMGEQVLAETNTDFEAEMDQLLIDLVHRPRPQPQGTLLSNVLKMRCMLKLWTCKKLYVQPFGTQDVRIPMDFKPVLESLRFAAAQVISELERQIIKELDIHRTKLKKTELLFERWVVLWQMILIYRQSLIWESERREADAAPLSEEASRGRDFRRDTTQLFAATVVTYNQLFSTKDTTLKKLRNTESTPFEPRFSAAWQRLPEFHARVLSQKLPTDDFFISFIVNREQAILEKLSRARR
ncbi:hypothetical protein VTJ49DRAFT_2301 [Mycothermus thermophilus]|uniref:Uncharacterized protein n=1 Tax=Humicola insolens TaxID=85995 RepID=A0ABR3VQQ0_HUMIN